MAYMPFLALPRNSNCRGVQLTVIIIKVVLVLVAIWAFYELFNQTSFLKGNRASTPFWIAAGCAVLYFVIDMLDAVI